MFELPSYQQDNLQLQIPRGLVYTRDAPCYDLSSGSDTSLVWVVERQPLALHWSPQEISQNVR
jgi:hypothetical protein